MINKSALIPFYYQIAAQLRDQIYSGKYAPRDRLPSENKLAEKYKVSRVTVRQALKVLERQHYIYREHGKGSFVAPIPTKGLFAFGSMTEKATRLGYHIASKILQFEEVDSLSPEWDPYTSLSNEFEVHGPFMFLKRLRYINEKPAALEEVFLPLHLYPGIETLEFTDRSLYKTMAEQWGIVPVLSDAFFAPAIADSDVAKYFQIDVGAPLQVTWGMVQSDTNYILEYAKTTFNIDLPIHYRLRRFDM